MSDAERFQQVFRDLEPVLDERLRRLLAAALARAWGYGGTTLVAQASGVARSTIRRGQEELVQPPQPPPEPRRVRRPGGGAPPCGRTGPDPGGRPGGAGRAGHPRRSAVAAALD